MGILIVMEKLEGLGYNLDRSFKTETADDRIGDIQAILINPENGELYGSTDSPRPGQAIGIKERDNKKE